MHTLFLTISLRNYHNFREFITRVSTKYIYDKSRATKTEILHSSDSRHYCYPLFYYFVLISSFQFVARTKARKGPSSERQRTL